MQTAYIYDAVRTPRGRGHAEKGALRTVPPIDLLQSVFSALQERNELDTSLVNDITIGCNTVSGEQGANIGKIAALYADWHHSINGTTISSFCTSGLEAVQNAAMKVMVGAADITVGGGVESMSRVPMFSDKGPWFADRNVARKTKFIHMGLSAEIIANLNDFKEEDLNAYTLRSHELATAAWTKESYRKSVIPVQLEDQLLLAQDELIRKGLTMDKLTSLPKVFDLERDAKSIAFIQKMVQGLDSFKCLHSVGSAPGIADAASGVLIGSKEASSKLNKQPIAKITGFASASVDPIIMLTGVVAATEKVIKNADLSLKDIDLFEINESFAAIPMMYQKALRIDSNKINVNGGAIAMGHPLGATGAILIGSLISELKARGLKRGIATICAGAGIAQATLIEMV